MSEDANGTWGRFSPAQIRRDVASANRLIEQARVTLVPHRIHFDGVEKAIEFLGLLQGKLSELARAIPEELPTAAPESTDPDLAGGIVGQIEL